MTQALSENISPATSDPEITVQSTTENKVKLTFYMIKMKWYHLHHPIIIYVFIYLFTYLPPLITTTGLAVPSWQGQIPSLIPVKSCWVEGPSWPGPI